MISGDEAPRAVGGQGLVACVAPEVGRGIRWLVDNAVAYEALLDAIDAARCSVWISQLAFDADCVAYDDAHGANDATGRRLVDAVIDASVMRGVDVRILLNETLLLNTARPLRAFLGRAGADGVQVRGIAAFPALLHAKVVVIDGSEAFLVGSPFANGYWDDSCHQPVDARRPSRELGGRPLHDLSCVVTGLAAGSIAAYFAELWNDLSTGPDEHRRLTVEPMPADGAALSVACTAPRGALSGRPEGATEILDAIEAGLAAAQSLVYIEHQYLSSRRVISALQAALARQPALEVIVVLNQNPDVTAYRGWQNARMREARLLDHPRVGVFALWSVTRCANHPVELDVNQRFVHSKALLIDDAWATVGSANLDGVSLHSYGEDFSSAVGRRVFRHARNFDVNLVLDDRQDALEGAVHDLRTRLWEEHLDGELPSEMPAAGWLAHWRGRAARNAAALGRDVSFAGGSVVLPYSTRATPSEQLADVGVDLAHLRLHFDPGWLEVYCSPSWVRNMFS